MILSDWSSTVPCSTHLCDAKNEEFSVRQRLIFSFLFASAELPWAPLFLSTNISLMFYACCSSLFLITAYCCPFKVNGTDSMVNYRTLPWCWQLGCFLALTFCQSLAQCPNPVLQIHHVSYCTMLIQQEMLLFLQSRFLGPFADCDHKKQNQSMSLWHNSSFIQLLFQSRFFLINTTIEFNSMSAA